MNTTTTTRGLTPAQVHAIQRISDHDNLVILVMLLALVAFLVLGHFVSKALTK